MNEKIKKTLKISASVILSILFIFLLSYFIKAEFIDKEECNVAGISLHGDLVTYISPSDFGENGNIIADASSSEDIVRAITKANQDDGIKAMLIEIDSYGGSPVAAEEIESALKRFSKPTIAYIRQAGISAAYWVATGAQTIFASKYSDVGSIAVTSSYLDNFKKNQKEGLTFNQLSSGKFKDAGNPDKPLTDEEKELILRDINIMHTDFIKAVAENRKLDISKIQSLADGSSMLGETALSNGLIDKIGGLNEVKEYIKGLIKEEPVICR